MKSRASLKSLCVWGCILMQEYIRCCPNQRRSLPATRETSSRNRFTITRGHAASRRSSEVDKIDMINLANDPLVGRHMPLSSGTFDEADYERFVADKERLWEEHGYGPWAFFVDGKFAGGVVYSQRTAMRMWRWSSTRTTGERDALSTKRSSPARSASWASIP